MCWTVCCSCRAGWSLRLGRCQRWCGPAPQADLVSGQQQQGRGRPFRGLCCRPAGKEAKPGPASEPERADTLACSMPPDLTSLHVPGRGRGSLLKGPAPGLIPPRHGSLYQGPHDILVCKDADGSLTGPVAAALQALGKCGLVGVQPCCGEDQPALVQSVVGIAGQAGALQQARHEQPVARI